MADPPASVIDLLDRSHRLGADCRTTNYGGGNTSCVAEEVDPVTGAPVEVLYVKGSGGDLGTLELAGLARLDLARVRALKAGYPGEAAEDDMVARLDYCCFGGPAAAPSIDTAMHALLPPRHVDHLHPDSGIALATAEDGEQLTKECFGDQVGWLPWRRPGFELALQIEALYTTRPDLRGVILGGHGITAWGRSSAECEANSRYIIETAEAFLVEHGRAEPFGPVRSDRTPLGEDARSEAIAALAPIIRGLASTDSRVVGHVDDSAEVLDFLSRQSADELVQLGTSCPDHFLRTKVKPLLLDLPSAATHDQRVTRLRELHAQYREDYCGYYQRWAAPGSPAMRGADPTVVLVPGIGMFSFGVDAQTARIAGEFYRNAIRVMRGAEAVARYRPIPESEKFRIEYWALEEAKLRRRPPARELAGRVALVTGAGSGIGRAIAFALARAGACVVVADLLTDRAAAVAAELGGPDVAVAATMDVADEAGIDRAFGLACRAFGGVDLVVNNAGLSISKPLVETTVSDWDRQHAVMARGSFLVSRAAARILADQAIGGDIVYVVSKNAVFAGPANLAYGAAKADQAHQVRLLAAELGGIGVRVNGVNPDGVVAGSGIFAEGWGAQRAAVYGVAEEELGAFYAGRTLLKREVLPEHVAEAVVVLASARLGLTTGTIIPVDGGVPAAFLR